MEKIKTIFFGTHEFAVEILQGLIDSPLFSVELVITQPDKPVGRKKELTPPPVKVLAEKYGIKIEQPESLKEFQIENYKFQIGITAQYGLLIPKHILEAPELGIINVHTSLLPKYRGASPIQSALIQGETKTGVTIMKMAEGLDDGPILLQKETDIHPDETYLELDTRLAKIGKETLLEALPLYISGELKPISQDGSQATSCKKLSRDDGKIDWNKTADEIYNLYRGLTPWPGVWTIWNDPSTSFGTGKRLKLLKIKKASLNLEAGKVKIDDNKLFIGTGENSVEILKLQIEGKPEMDSKTFVNGYKQIDNALL